MMTYIFKTLLASGLAVTLCGCGSPEGESSSNLSAIPDAMHGKWGMNASDCHEGQGASHSWIKVDASSVMFFENGYKLVEAKSYGTNRFTAVFDYEGYEATTRSTEALRLSQDGTKLTFESSPPLIYTRCG